MHRKIVCISKIILLIYFLMLFFLLISSNQVASYAMESICQWLTKIVPTLFPFMMLHSCMTISRSDLLLSKLFYPLFSKVFFVSKYGCYCIIVGFLFGFPMGAKVISQFYKEGKISELEANTLLGFCNTFSPAYYKGFVYPALLVLQPEKALFLFTSIYWIPLLFGCFLCRKNLFHAAGNIHPYVNDNKSINFLTSFQWACESNLKAIAMIGANMLIANILRCSLSYFPLADCYQDIFGCLFEVTIGLPLLYQNTLLTDMEKAIAMLVLLSFGGLSGIMQAFTFIVSAHLSTFNYIKNKILISILTMLIAYLLLKIPF